MDFSEAAQRYLELKLMLENHQITKADFDQQAGGLRVLGPDNAWWQIRAVDGAWFRWDGQTWNQVTPPESSFDRPTELAFKVKSDPSDEQPATRQPTEYKPMPPARPRGALRILRGQPALDLLLEEMMVREIYTARGKRYQVVNPRPSGSVQGIAFRISTDGYLDPDVAVEALLTGDGISTQKLQTPAQGSLPVDVSLGEGRARDFEPQVSGNPAGHTGLGSGVPAYAALSPRFQAAIDQFREITGEWMSNSFEIQTARQIATNLGGAFERDSRQLEIPALGPLAGEALSWWHSIFTTQSGFSKTLVNNCLTPIAQRFTLLADQPPLYLATSRLLKEFKPILTQPSREIGLPLSAVFPLILSNPTGLEDLSSTTFARKKTYNKNTTPEDVGEAADGLENLLRGAAYNRLSSSMDLSRGLYNPDQGRLTMLAGAQKTMILQDIRDSALKTIDQLSYSGDPYLLATSHIQLAAAIFDLAPVPEAGLADFQQHLDTALAICKEQANGSRHAVLWLNTQFIPWALVLLTFAALAVPQEGSAELDIALEAAADELDRTYERQLQLRESAVRRLFHGRAVLAIIQQITSLQNKTALKAFGVETLEAALVDFIYAGDLHLAKECRQMVKALN